MKTTVTKASDIKRAWHVIDVKKQTLGRVSTQIASLLMGKHKPNLSQNLDCGDYVVVVNAKEVKVTGNKSQDKLYQRHSMYPGGFREINFADQMALDPAKVIMHSVKGMLPKNRLRADRLKRLKIFTTDSHPYQDKVGKKEE